MGFVTMYDPSGEPSEVPNREAQIQRMLDRGWSLDKKRTAKKKAAKKRTSKGGDG